MAGLVGPGSRCAHAIAAAAAIASTRIAALAVRRITCRSAVGRWGAEEVDEGPAGPVVSGRVIGEALSQVLGDRVDETVGDLLGDGEGLWSQAPDADLVGSDLVSELSDGGSGLVVGAGVSRRCR